MAGDDPASRSYVNSKSRLAEKLGIHSELIRLPENIAAEAIGTSSRKRTPTRTIHAILVQMPLPKHLDSWKILDCLTPEKDADCFHPVQPGADPAEPVQYCFPVPRPG